MVRIVPVSVTTSISLKLHRLSTTPNLLRIGSQLRKCEETRDWKQQAHQLCRFKAEKSTWKTDRYFVDFESQIHVEISTSSRCHNFHLDLPFKVN